RTVFLRKPYSASEWAQGPPPTPWARLTTTERLAGEQADQLLLAREAGLGQHGLDLAAHRFPVDACRVGKCIDGFGLANAPRHARFRRCQVEQALQDLRVRHRGAVDRRHYQQRGGLSEDI